MEWWLGVDWLVVETLVRVVFLVMGDLNVEWKKSLEDKGEKVGSQRRVYIYVRDGRARL